MKLEGNENTIIGDNTSDINLKGSKNTIVKLTDTNGNTTFNKYDSIAIGSGAQAGLGSIAIGAGAGAGANWQKNSKLPEINLVKLSFF